MSRQVLQNNQHLVSRMVNTFLDSEVFLSHVADFDHFPFKIAKNKQNKQGGGKNDSKKY